MSQLSKLVKEFNKNYEFLYENADNAAGYRQALEWFDANSTSPKIAPIIDLLVSERNDFISSDREAVAFAFACQQLDIV